MDTLLGVARGGDMGSFLRREARLTYAVICKDLSVSVVPALLLMISAFVAARRSTAEALMAMPAGALYFVFYLYCFCMSNQITGVAEDRFNKPDRPLVTGALDLPGAKRRWIVAMVLFPLVALAAGGLQTACWAVFWEGLIIVYNYYGLDRHWVGKNVIFISAGTAALLVPAWQIAAPRGAVPWGWLITISLSFGISLQLQDLRDVTGDRRVRRRTLPLTAGEPVARLVIAALIGLLLPWVMHAATAARTTGQGVWELSLVGVNVIVAARTLRGRSAREDHATYILHTYWFCCALLTPAVNHLFAGLTIARL